MSNTEQKSSKKYAKISIKRRNHLIDFVLNQNKEVAQIAKRLNIKLSTAKHIIKTYKEKGYLYNKRMNKNESPQNQKGQKPHQIPITTEISKVDEKNDEIKVEYSQQSPFQPNNYPQIQNFEVFYIPYQFPYFPFVHFQSNNLM